jgi:hypothetical protein
MRTMGCAATRPTIPCRAQRAFTAQRKTAPLKPIAYICLIVLVCIFGWHIILWSSAPKIADVESHPLTDVVYVYVPDSRDEGVLGKDFAAGLKGARDLLGGAIGDKELESRARENFDVYAMILPYHVIFKDKRADAPSPVAAIPQQRLEPHNEAPVEEPVAPRSDEYVNSRFGFSATIPAGFEPAEPPTNGDGIHYTSTDGLAKITMYGSNSDGQTTKEYYDQIASGLGTEPTYSRLADDWFVLSGQKGDTIFYTKVFVGSHSLNALTFEYPAEQADQYRLLNDFLVRSFKHGDLDQSW